MVSRFLNDSFILCHGLVMTVLDWFGRYFWSIGLVAILIATRRYVQPDRQTDILLTEIKVITDLFVIVMREIYVHVYTTMLIC